jgi:4-hydroxybutyrate CoA-transferase
MKIRVKYCGGCNPRYDRKAVTEEIRNACPQAEVIERHVDEPVDFVAVICGCSATCAAHEDLHGTRGKVVISSEDESGKIYEAVKVPCR